MSTNCSFRSCKNKVITNNMCKFHNSMTENIVLCEEKAKEMIAETKKTILVCKNDRHKNIDPLDRIFEKVDPKSKRTMCDICSGSKKKNDTNKISKIHELITKAYADFPTEHEVGKRICSHRDCEFRNKTSVVVEMFMPKQYFISESSGKETTQCSVCRGEKKNMKN